VKDGEIEIGTKYGGMREEGGKEHKYGVQDRTG
jgi:hypothetical protein